MTKKIIDRSAGHMTLRAGVLKAPWLAHCRKQKILSSNLLRKLMQSEIKAYGDKGEISPGVNTNYESQEVKEMGRIELKIPSHIRVLLAQMATSEGFPSLNRFAVAFLSAKATGTPQLNFDEFKALIESNRRILAIGRNLNQLVIDLKCVNANKPDANQISNFRFGVLEQLQAQIANHTVLVRQVLSANITRWNA